MRCLTGLFVLSSWMFGVTLGFQTTRHLVTSTRNQNLRQPKTGNDHRLPVKFLRETTASSVEGTSGKEWLQKAFHNTPAFRSAAILAALGLAGCSSKAPIALIPSAASASIHLLSFATWFGTVFYTTFILGLTMYKNLPRKVFGNLQSKLFPKYFQLSSICILLQLVTLSNLTTIAPAASKALGVALVMTLINQFYLEPKSTKVMFDRYALDDIPGATDSDKYKALKSTFGKLHGMSSMTNLIAFCGAILHGVYISTALIR